MLGVGHFIGGVISMSLGALNRVLGDFVEAERCYAVAAAIADRMRSPLTKAWIAVDQAQLYLQPQVRDTARASAFLAQALPIAEQVGAGLLRRRIRELAAELESLSEAPPTRHRPGPVQNAG